jgi:hypothetical protein
MLLKSLTYEDKQSGWKLDDLHLDRFNLLVGASGVGKTRILRAIRTVAHIGRGGGWEALAKGLRFALRFEDDADSFVWTLESEPRDAAEDESSEPALPGEQTPFIRAETLKSNATAEQIVEREQGRFFFRGKELPVLNRSVSAFNLLDDPLSQHLRQTFAEKLLDDRSGSALKQLTSSMTRDSIGEDVQSLDELRNRVRWAPIIKAFILQEKFPEQFMKVKQLFLDIFPTVEDVTVSSQFIGGTRLVAFKLKEQGVGVWILGEGISSGMIRTFIHLIELMLAPAGTVVLIDEFENSLGVNCMGPLTDFVLSRANELQFIITSHHPYIINNIPKEYWKVVHRTGSTVRVTPATEIRALQGHSAQDAFTRLINAPEFEQGMP